MVADHLVVPDAKWFVKLMASAAVGAVAYFGMLLAVGLPANERTIVGKLISKVARRGADRPAAG